jgi:hypothetical protein
MFRSSKSLFLSSSLLLTAKIHQDPAAILTNNDLFMGADIKLSLWRDLIKTSAAGITLDRYYSQTIPGISTDLLVSNNQPLFHRFLDIG